MIAFVVNENSGNGRGKKVWMEVESELLRRKVAYIKIAEATKAEAVSEADKLLKRGEMKAVAVVGGDGSLHDILPLALEYGIPIGIIPSGSGNDTSRTFGIPNDPVKALDVILAGATRPVDLVESNAASGSRQYTITAIAVGLDGAVASDVNGSRYKRWCNRLGLGPLAYIIGFFRALSFFRSGTVKLTLDGAVHTFEKGWLTAVASMATYGGGLRICPDARYDDGKLHVCIVHGCEARHILVVFPKLLKGKHVTSPYVTILTGRSVSIETSSTFLAYGDGEPSGQTPLHAEIKPRQLVFLTATSG